MLVWHDRDTMLLIDPGYVLSEWIVWMCVLRLSFLEAWKAGLPHECIVKLNSCPVAQSVVVGEVYNNDSTVVNEAANDLPSNLGVLDLRHEFQTLFDKHNLIWAGKEFAFRNVFRAELIILDLAVLLIRQKPVTSGDCIIRKRSDELPTPDAVSSLQHG
jgi:hypothetical protein